MSFSQIKQAITPFVLRTTYFVIEKYIDICRSVSTLIKKLTMVEAKGVPGHANMYRLDYILEGQQYTILIKKREHIFNPLCYAAIEIYRTLPVETTTETTISETEKQSFCTEVIECTDLIHQLYGPNGDFHGCSGDITLNDVYACLRPSALPENTKLVTIDKQGNTETTLLR